MTVLIAYFHPFLKCHIFVYKYRHLYIYGKIPENLITAGVSEEGN